MSTIKKLTNIITILLCIISLHFYFVAVPVFAAGDCELILSSAQGNKGDEVTIKMILQSNSGLAGLQYIIKYDTSALSLVSAKAIEGVFSDPIVNTENEGEVVYVFAEATSNTRTGDLLEVTFKILDEATNDNVDLKLDKVMGVDNDVNIVNVKTTIEGIELTETGNSGGNNNSTDVANNPTSNNNATIDNTENNNTENNNTKNNNTKNNNTENSNNSNNINNSTNNTQTDKDGNIISNNSNDKNNSDNKSNKGIIIFIIIVVVILLAVAGYVIYNKKFKKNNDNSDNNNKIM